MNVEIERHWVKAGKMKRGGMEDRPNETRAGTISWQGQRKIRNGAACLEGGVRCDGGQVCYLEVAVRRGARWEVKGASERDGDRRGGGEWNAVRGRGKCRSERVCVCCA